MDGATLLRTARRRAHMTQQELAHRAGVTQSVISVYESGRRQPSLPMLTSLVEATGLELHLELKAVPRRLDRLVGPIGQLVRSRRRELIDAAARHGVRNLRVFGSVARGEERADSDLDLLADLPSDMGLVGLDRVRSELEAIVGCPVDLGSAGDLKRDVLTRIGAEAVAL